MSPVPKRNWGAGVATDSPVAGLRSAHHVLRPDRAFWFRRLATPVLSEDGARFRALLRSDRLATFLPLHRSGRTVRRHFSLRGSLHPSDPKVSGISRLLRSDRLATFFPRRRSGRTTRRHFVHRGLLYPAGPKAALVSRRSARFDPKTHLSFPVGRRGRARSSEESQQPGHRRPTKIVCRSILSSLCRLDALSCPRLPGSMNSVPLRPAIIPPESFLIPFGPSDA